MVLGLNIVQKLTFSKGNSISGRRGRKGLAKSIRRTTIDDVLVCFNVPMLWGSSRELTLTSTHLWYVDSKVSVSCVGGWLRCVYRGC